jgi:protocatechuate 3,4-dioxygenase, beta subunit
MNKPDSPNRHRTGRREFITGCALSAAWLAVPGAFAEELVRTPRMTEGPFYPDRLPLDTDNDLIRINDAVTPAVGEITRLTGRILGPDGTPLAGALVEIWQVDRNGVYLHSGSDNSGRRDRNFQGYGRFETASSGEYLFRTIKPVTYSGRAPHVHFAVTPRGGDKFITQCFVAGAPQNDGDFLLRRITDSRARAALIVPWAPVSGSSTGELQAKFDVVLGRTPAG